MIEGITTSEVLATQTGNYPDPRIGRSDVVEDEVSGETLQSVYWQWDEFSRGTIVRHPVTEDELQSVERRVRLDFLEWYAEEYPKIKKERR